ncbi:MAG: hypothetical protein HY720_21105 [Planctomycetes bacterium]|nr:hypothetical protein [Planctomycetota bacterium]
MARIRIDDLRRDVILDARTRELLKGGSLMSPLSLLGGGRQSRGVPLFKFGASVLKVVLG